MKFVVFYLFFFMSFCVCSQQLDTAHYSIQISQQCPEGEVQCQQVIYKGVSKVSGASIELKGQSWHTRCADGVTPCRFLGYEFKNGRLRYLVHESGLLQVIGSRGNVIVEEQGRWSYPQSK